MLKKTLPLLFFSVFLLCNCTKHEIDSRHDVNLAPVEIKPIHITIDINIKVDKALDDFFGDLDAN
ncbi:hypothetical protein KAR91_11555 [Candidatus Pacearchaeota archaeon]|nr:hypothetical protein [Candidatus Pacearchaeota archaeon]